MLGYKEHLKYWSIPENIDFIMSLVNDSKASVRVQAAKTVKSLKSTNYSAIQMTAPNTNIIENNTHIVENNTNSYGDQNTDIPSSLIDWDDSTYSSNAVHTLSGPNISHTFPMNGKEYNEHSTSLLHMEKDNFCDNPNHISNGGNSDIFDFKDLTISQQQHLHQDPINPSIFDDIFQGLSLSSGAASSATSSALNTMQQSVQNTADYAYPSISTGISVEGVQGDNAAKRVENVYYTPPVPLYAPPAPSYTPPFPGGQGSVPGGVPSAMDIFNNCDTTKPHSQKNNVDYSGNLKTDNNGGYRGHGNENYSQYPQNYQHISPQRQSYTELPNKMSLNESYSHQNRQSHQYVNPQQKQIHSELPNKIKMNEKFSQQTSQNYQQIDPQQHLQNYTESSNKTGINGNSNFTFISQSLDSKPHLESQIYRDIKPEINPDHKKEGLVDSFSFLSDVLKSSN